MSLGLVILLICIFFGVPLFLIGAEIIDVDKIAKFFSREGKRDFLLALVFDGYCQRELVIRAYDKDHAREKLDKLKYVKGIKFIKYIPENKLNEVLKTYFVNGGEIL